MFLNGLKCTNMFWNVLECHKNSRMEASLQSEKVNMECLVNIKELLQREYKMAVEESKYASAMKENSVQFNNACSSCSEIACHNIDSKDKSQNWKSYSPFYLPGVHENERLI